MNQNEQMRSIGHFYNLIRHALMDVEDKNSCSERLHDILEQLEALAAEPAPLVRLTDEDIWSDDGIMSVNADLGLTFDEISQLANAIIDAMIAKNGGKV